MKTIVIAISSLLLVGLLHCVAGQSPAPSPSSDCFDTLVNMSDCLTYVETGSNLTVPDKACCPELAGMVENTPVCLCQLLGNTSSLGIDIDLQRALRLPSACDVVTPSATLCSAVGVPIPGPASPEILPTSSPPGNGSPSPPASSSAVICVVIAVVLVFVHLNTSPMIMC
ncbi:hypothetical protein MLD38_008184 [Melastoma candidum]|uniref:Uncharacterized protein n=1 Tax=Melastoma candidum TaxID=119954 RepID=A0ACB9RX84_9MYRT|nr:hypothetical protein MLD38_008184 [Melastoma candidum]